MAKVDLKKLLKNYNRRVDRANKKFDSATKAERRVLIAKDVLKQLASRRIRAKSGVWLRNTDGGAIPEAPNTYRPYWSEDAGTEDQDKKDLKAIGDMELQDVLTEMKSCQACQLGALFSCTVQLADKFKVKDLAEFDEVNGGEISEVSMKDIENYLSKFFTKNQIKLMEIAFERGYGGYNVLTPHYDSDTIITRKRDVGESFGAETFQFVDIGDDKVSVQEKDALFFTLKQRSASKRMKMIMENVIENDGTFVPPKDARSRQ